MRASFSYRDIQKRSAGSFLLGIYHSIVTFSSADSLLVSINIRNNFSKELYEINAVSLITKGLSGGYLGFTQKPQNKKQTNTSAWVLYKKVKIACCLFMIIVLNITLYRNLGFLSEPYL
jgi:hypothetical protein